MSLDAVVVLTLEGQDWRKWLCTGGLLARDVLLKCIRYHVGPPALDYSGTLSVLESAIADGFPRFQESIDDGSFKALNVAMAAQFWSYMKICRESVEKDETYLWIHDDHRLVFDFWRYGDLVNGLEENVDVPFRFCLLTCSDFGRKQPSLEVLDYVLKVYSGVRGPSDVGVIVSPLGAEWLLDNGRPSVNSAWGNFETWMEYLSLYTPELEGAYSVCVDAVCPFEHHSYVGSTIHDVETGEVLRLSYDYGGHI